MGEKKKLGCGSIFLIVLVGYFIINSYVLKNNRSEVENSIPEISISAADLVAAYDANEVNANYNYKDKILRVRGTVRNIGEGVGGVYVTIGDTIFKTVHCSFQDSQKGAIANMSEGQEITVKGRCTGKMMDPILNDCILTN
jgi:hypothetical protein